MSDSAIASVVAGIVAIAGGVGKYLIEHQKLKNSERELNKANKKIRSLENRLSRYTKLLK